MKFAEVRLLASNIDALVEFYVHRLGLRLSERTSQYLRICAGQSSLLFVQDIAPAQYHFAFNVPFDQFAEAKLWFGARCPLVRDESGEAAFHFANWNADAVYFYDPSGNLVELIARQGLDVHCPHIGSFDGRALLSLSEIGVVTDDVRATAMLACNALSASPYRSELNDAFVPVGDEEGLLIVVARGRPWFPDRSLAAQPSPTKITLASVAFEVQIGLTPDVTVASALRR
jgi:catechol 2,3-dioxygenase-like lactoylglutathione lyase family enzyme